MGNELACDCICRAPEQETPYRSHSEAEAQKLKLNTKFEESDFLYNYSYGMTKINLIKTSNIEIFFKSKNFLKVDNKKEVKRLFLSYS